MTAATINPERAASAESSKLEVDETSSQRLINQQQADGAYQLQSGEEADPQPLLRGSQGATHSLKKNVLKVLYRGAPRPSEENTKAMNQISSDLQGASSGSSGFIDTKPLSIFSDFNALAIIGVVICGLCLDCVDWSHSSSLGLGILWWKWSFYTIQSNTLVSLFYLASLTFFRKPSRTKTIIKSCVVMMISITMTVWHVILVNTIRPGDYTDWKPRWASHILHTIVPLMCWFDWLVLDQLLSSSSTKLRLRHVPLFLICPLSYLTFSFIRASIGGPYGVSHLTGEPFWHWYPFIELSNPLPIYPAAASLKVSTPAAVVLLNCLTIALAVETAGIMFVLAHNCVGR